MTLASTPNVTPTPAANAARSAATRRLHGNEPAGTWLEGPVGRVEAQLEALQGALRADDAAALEAAAGGLQHALAAAVGQFREAARQGGVPTPLRQRLSVASARVAAQRQALARATASLDRAIEALLPAPAAVYDAGGAAARLRSSGSVSA